MSLSGSLSRHKAGAAAEKLTVLSDNKTLSQQELQTCDNGGVDIEVGLDISESDSETFATNSGSFFSTISSPKKTVVQDSHNPFVGDDDGDHKNNKILDAMNPFNKSKTDLDKNNPFYRDTAKGLDNTERLDKSKPFYNEEDVGANAGKQHVILYEEKPKNYCTENRSETTITEDVDQSFSQNSVYSDSSHKTPNRSIKSLTTERNIYRRLSSDIEVLTEDSTSPESVYRKDKKPQHTKMEVDVVRSRDHFGVFPDKAVDVLSPVGSLTNRAVHDMVDFMRNSSIYDTSATSSGEYDFVYCYINLI